MNAKACLLILGLVLLLAGVGGAGWVANHFWGPSAHQPGSANRQRELPGTPEGGGEGVVCTGYVDLEHGIRSLAPLQSGRVAAILVQETTHVEAGTPLLRLEDQDAKWQLETVELAVTTAEIQLEEALKLKEQQRARLAQQQAALAAAGFRLDAARQMLQNKEKQLKDNLLGVEEVRITRDEAKALEQQERAEREKLAELKTVDPALTVRKAHTQLKISRIRRDQARRQLDECTLKAPVAGTVQRITVGVGDIVAGNLALPIGGTGGSPVVLFAPDESPLVRAEVAQEFADRVQVGQSAVIRDDTRPSTTWNGKVKRVAGWYDQRRPTTLDPSVFTDVRTVECLITIAPGPPPPRLGQRMRVMIGRVPPTAGE